LHAKKHSLQHTFDKAWEKGLKVKMQSKLLEEMYTRISHYLENITASGGGKWTEQQKQVAQTGYPLPQ
jgi:hydroxylamine reductase (hybrid-cluster protein)